MNSLNLEHFAQQSDEESSDSSDSEDDISGIVSPIQSTFIINNNSNNIDRTIKCTSRCIKGLNILLIIIAYVGLLKVCMC